MESPKREKGGSPRGVFEDCREILSGGMEEGTVVGFAEGQLGRVEIPAEAGDHSCVGCQSAWHLSFTSGPGSEKVDGCIGPRVQSARQAGGRMSLLGNGRQVMRQRLLNARSENSTPLQANRSPKR